MFSFIVPYRKNRAEHLKNFGCNIASHYKNCEVIIAEQDDDNPFKRGQLLNLGFKKSSGEIVIFLDVDIRFVEFLDFNRLMKESGKPFLPWDHRQQIVEESPNQFVILKDECYYCTQGFGGMTVFTRNQFSDCEGFSNRFCGWGAEDTELNIRVNGIRRFSGNLYHVKHPSYMKEFDPTKDKYTLHNRKMLSERKKYNPKLDSFRHTVADEEIQKDVVSDFFKHYRFRNISVSDDCPYKKLVTDIYESKVQ